MSEHNYKHNFKHALHELHNYDDEYVKPYFLELDEVYAKAEKHNKFQKDLAEFNTNPSMSERQFITYLFNEYESGDSE